MTSNLKSKNNFLSGICLAIMHSGDLEQLFMALNYHLNCGIEKIFVFLDNPKLGLDEHLEQHKKIQYILCDDMYWLEKLTVSPTYVEQKQRFVMREGSVLAAELGINYIIIIDSDELISCTQKLKPILEKIGPSTGAFTILVAEARLSVRSSIQNPFSAQVFVLPDPDVENEALLKDIYLEKYPLLHGGLWGHTAGKTIYRTPIAYNSYSLHRPSSEKSEPAVHQLASGDAIVLHFDCGSVRTWAIKWGLRLSGLTNAAGMSQLRISQMQEISQALEQGGGAIEKLFRSFFVLNKKAIDRLAKVGLILKPEHNSSKFQGPLPTKNMAGIYSSPGSARCMLQLQPKLKPLKTTSIKNDKRLSKTYSTEPKAIQIAFACDRNFLKPSFACILSFMDNLQSSLPVLIHILGDGITPKDARYIQQLESVFENLKIQVHDETAKLDRDVGKQDIKRSTYSRLYLPDHVFQGRLLYIDSDMLIMSDLSRIFSMNLDKAIIAGVTDSASLRIKYAPETVPQAQSERLLSIVGGADNILTYLNAGFLVIDLDHPKYLELALKCQNLMRDPSVNLTQRDQDAINICFTGYKKILPYKYNYMIQFFESNRAIAPEIRKLKYSAIDAHILHYSGKSKPWDARSQFDDFYTGIYVDAIQQLEIKLRVDCGFDWGLNNDKQKAATTSSQFSNKKEKLNLLHDVSVVMKKISAVGFKKPNLKHLKKRHSKAEIEQPDLSKSPTAILGFFEHNDRMIVKGWVHDKEKSSRRLRVSLYVDGDVVETTTANRQRNDLKKPGQRDGKHGFLFHLSGDLVDGNSHIIEVKLADFPDLMIRNAVLKVDADQMIMRLRNSFKA